MNKRKQQIIIAEICGWEVSRIIPPNSGKFPCGWNVNFNNGDLTVIPDYPSDLNAMHEAEKVLYAPGMGKTKYECELEKIIKRDTPKGRYVDHRIFSIAHSTAAQRARAFLKALNLWTD